MIRFLKSLGLFSVFTLVVYVMLVIISGYFVPKKWHTNLVDKLGGYGFLFSRLKEADTTQKVDILILGSSHAYRSYDPRIFRQKGLRIINLGSSSQTPVQTEVFLNRYIKKLQPKLIIFDVYPKVLEFDGVESGLDVLGNAKMGADLVRMATKINNIRIYNTLIYAYSRTVLSPDKNRTEDPKKENDTYVGGGFVQSYEKFREGQRYIDTVYKPNDLQLNAFARVVKYFKDNKYPYVLIQAPMSQRYYASTKNNNEMDKLYAKNGPYLNANNVLKLPDSCFRDNGHLNQYGVDVYNKVVLDFIKGRIAFK